MEGQLINSASRPVVRTRKKSKGSILKEELIRAIWNPRWLFIVLIAGVMLIVGSYNWSQKAPHPVNWLMLQLFFGHYQMLAPFIAAVPFTDSFINDRDQGFGRLILQRARHTSYLRCKAVAVFVSGGLSLVLVLLVMFVINAIGGGDWATRVFISNGPHASPAGPFGFLYALNPLYYFGYLLVLNFFLGGSFALLGLTLSVLVGNRYLGIIGPVVILQLWSFLVERTASLTQITDPLENLLPWYGFYEAAESAMLPAQILQISLISFSSLLVFYLLTRTNRNKY